MMLVNANVNHGQVFGRTFGLPTFSFEIDVNVFSRTFAH